MASCTDYQVSDDSPRTTKLSRSRRKDAISRRNERCRAASHPRRDSTSAASSVLRRPARRAKLLAFRPSRARSYLTSVMAAVPDMSHLTPEERNTIEEVMIRQKLEEEMENEIMRYVLQLASYLYVYTCTLVLFIFPSILSSVCLESSRRHGTLCVYLYEDKMYSAIGSDTVEYSAIQLRRTDLPSFFLIASIRMIAKRFLLRPALSKEIRHDEDSGVTRRTNGYTRGEGSVHSGRK